MGRLLIHSISQVSGVTLLLYFKGATPTGVGFGPASHKPHDPQHHRFRGTSWYCRRITHEIQLSFFLRFRSDTESRNLSTMHSYRCLWFGDDETPHLSVPKTSITPSHGRLGIAAQRTTGKHLSVEPRTRGPSPTTSTLFLSMMRTIPINRHPIGPMAPQRSHPFTSTMFPATVPFLIQRYCQYTRNPIFYPQCPRDTQIPVPPPDNRYVYSTLYTIIQYPDQTF